MNEEINPINLINSKVEDFPLEVFHDNKINTKKLSDYEGKWLVLFFYPADFTFVCPTELEELAKMYPEFQEIDTEILSVSTDTAFAHKAWHDSSEAISKVNYPMAADTNGKLTRSLGVYIEEEGQAQRGTFIISPDGEIKSVEVNDNSIGRSAKELMRKLKAAQFVSKHGDKVCPAGWEEGDDTLTPGVDLVGKI